MSDKEYYQPLLKFVGKEVILINKRYRIVGIFDDNYTLYFICYDGYKEYIILNSFFYYGLFHNDNELANLATPEKCMELINDSEETIYTYISDGILYGFDLHLQPEEMGYIFYNDKEIRLNTDIIVGYNHKSGEFVYEEPMFGVKLSNKNFVRLKADIKKAFYDLTEKYLTDKLSKKQAQAFKEVYIYSSEITKDKK